MRKALNGKYPKLVCPGCGHGTLSRRLGAEFVGTAILLTAIVGSAATADALSGGNLAAVVFINAVATGLTLITLIMIFGPISGAHFNPAVTLVDVLIGGSTWPHAGAYVAAQLAGAVVGIMIVHGMHELSLLSLSGQVRSGSGVMVGEFVATFGLLAVILGCMQFRKSSIAFAVGYRPDVHRDRRGHPAGGRAGLYFI
jgi:glycerol uptake facilitator-like aquaporin